MITVVYLNLNHTKIHCRLENCRNAMQAAKDNFDIPLILTPENLASPDLDELSGMTYLSYFMKVDSPGYFATLGWTQQMIPHKNVKNFQVTDGMMLALKIENGKLTFCLFVYMMIQIHYHDYQFNFDTS